MKTNMSLLLNFILFQRPQFSSVYMKYPLITGKMNSEVYLSQSQFCDPEAMITPQCTILQLKIAPSAQTSLPLSLENYTLVMSL